MNRYVLLAYYTLRYWWTCASNWLHGLPLYLKHHLWLPLWWRARGKRCVQCGFKSSMYWCLACTLRGTAPAVQHYKDLMEALISARATGPLSQEEESDRVELLDGAWRQLSPAEQEEVERWCDEIEGS